MQSKCQLDLLTQKTPDLGVLIEMATVVDSIDVDACVVVEESTELVSASEIDNAIINNKIIPRKVI